MEHSFLEFAIPLPAMESLLELHETSATAKSETELESTEKVGFSPETASRSTGEMFWRLRRESFCRSFFVMERGGGSGSSLRFNFLDLVVIDVWLTRKTEKNFSVELNRTLLRF